MIIAIIALVNELKLITKNLKHFPQIPKLKNRNLLT